MPHGIRPTQDRVRKSLFDVLGKDVADRRVLDLFAGSGALGVEALSRGAVSALFVDEDAGVVRTILANLADLGLMEKQAKGPHPPPSPSLSVYGEGGGIKGLSSRLGEGEVALHPSPSTFARVEVWRADYRRAVRRIKGEGRAFDLVLLDPPYREGLLPEALWALTGAGGVAPSGLVVAEAEARLLAPEVNGLTLIDERTYGGTKLMFWVKRETVGA